MQNTPRGGVGMAMIVASKMLRLSGSVRAVGDPAPNANR